MTDHVDEALSLLGDASTRNMSAHLLAAAQVRATLAVEQAVRDQTEVLTHHVRHTAAALGGAMDENGVWVCPDCRPSSGSAPGVEPLG